MENIVNNVVVYHYTNVHLRTRERYSVWGWRKWKGNTE